ncbi:hypothetical protein lpari_01705 [Legionella parisiensis]|uniref:Uncharacterized protein n=1 Tax=Legionella parisiensis TaxID=45071 RepID=A0A1E5JRZ1_9GAMM|nr:hypothetical protein lpari_01705 [Legionella parisiensis]STX76693.1 Uncharacterised protein [Legionella parisiensis]
MHDMPPLYLDLFSNFTERMNCFVGTVLELLCDCTLRPSALRTSLPQSFKESISFYLFEKQP